MDVHSKEIRSYNMSQIKGKDTKPEILVRKWLWQNGFKYRLYRKDLPGKPDIVFPGKKKILYINGCFWHKHNCKYFKWPRTNSDFWKEKIGKNVIRDKRNLKEIKTLGWKYLIIWECELKKGISKSVLKRIIKFLNN